MYFIYYTCILYIIHVLSIYRQQRTHTCYTHSQLMLPPSTLTGSVTFTQSITAAS